MKDQIQESRRSFLKTTTAGAAGIMLGGASIKNVSASSGGAWTTGMQVNPAINNLRVVCAHDTRLGSVWDMGPVIDEIMDKMAMALSKKSTASEAWATIFRKPASKAWADVQVGFKGSWLLPGFIVKVANELKKLGVPYANMVYFDCNTNSPNCASDLSSKFPAGSGFRWSGPAFGPNDTLHGTTPAPVPYKGVMVNMNCCTDVANGTIDILITSMTNHGHGDSFGGASLTCKSLYGVFNAADSIQFLHGNIGGNPDGITGLLSLQKSQAILGGDPPRQQLILMGDTANPAQGGTNRMVMGTFAPIVDYLTITKIRGEIQGNAYNATVVKRYYQDFGYTDADVAGLDFVDAMAYNPTGAARHPQQQPDSRLSLVVSNPAYKLSTIDFRLPYSLPLVVSVRIFDGRGRLVGELKPVWDHSMMAVWDGRAQSGMRMPAGMYAVKVKCGQNTATGSIVLAPR